MHPQTVTMGLPMAGAAAVGQMAASAAQGLMMHPGGISPAVGIVRVPPMMAGIAGTPAPPLPAGTPFGHPMMRPPMGSHPGFRQSISPRLHYDSSGNGAIGHNVQRWSGNNGNFYH